MNIINYVIKISQSMFMYHFIVLIVILYVLSGTWLKTI